MGTIFRSYLGYGFKIDKKTCEDFCGVQYNACDNEITKELYKTNKYDTIFHSYLEDGPEDFICIKDSIFTVFYYEDNAKILSFDLLKIKDNWNELLLDFANKHNIIKPELSWILCCSTI